MLIGSRVLVAQPRLHGLDRKRVLQLASAHQIVPNAPSGVVRSIGQSKMANPRLYAI